MHRGFKLRKQFFESLVRFCNNLITEIEFSKRTVTQIIDAYIDGYSPQFADMLLSYKALVEARADVTYQNMVLWDKLKHAEAQAVADFFLGLGKHSSGGELGKIRNAKLRFEAFSAEAADKLKRDASIYFKICILLGVGVVILLI